MIQIFLLITIFLDLKLFKQLWFSFFLSLIDTEYNIKENKDQTSLKFLNNHNNKNIETQHIVESHTFAVSSRILKFLTVVRLMMEQKLIRFKTTYPLQILDTLQIFNA